MPVTLETDVVHGGDDRTALQGKPILIDGIGDSRHDEEGNQQSQDAGLYGFHMKVPYAEGIFIAQTHLTVNADLGAQKRPPRPSA